MSSPSATEPGSSATPVGSAWHWALTEALLEAALQAQRVGSLDELVRERPLAARWMLRRHQRSIRGTAADTPGWAEQPRIAALLLRWLVTQLRPDTEPGFDRISDEVWLGLAAWRPMLAMASHEGYLRVPDFPRVYRRRSGEAPLDNLCGLWGVGPSTVYRSLEKARHAMTAVLLDPAPDAVRRLSLRLAVQREIDAVAGPETDADRCTWHSRLAMLAQAARDPASELWHRWRADDVAGFIQVVRKHAGTLAGEVETAALLERVAAQPLEPRLQVELWLARAALARTRNAAERELRAYESALRAAQAAESTLLLGIVHGELGKFYEARDADRAFACYQDSAEFLQDREIDAADLPALGQYATTLTRLAWLYVVRNDERSRALLDRADALRRRFDITGELAGMLEQAWAEYWRRAGNPGLALEHRYRALNIFERLGDRRSVLATTLNLVTMHGERGNLERAIECARKIFEAARDGSVEPALVVSTHLNLGLAHFASDDLDTAIAEYRLALDESLATGLRLHAFRARYNLAEAHFLRFRRRRGLADEETGDRYVQEALAAPESDSSPAAIESARKLKQEVLSAGQPADPDRLLPGEDAIHFDEMAEVHRQRQLLSVPGNAQTQARARLAIARAYLAIASKEREAALELVARHGLQQSLGQEFDALRQTFQRELTREQQLVAAWKKAAGDLVDDNHRAALIAHLVREGTLSKSGYAELCDVAPATASKHLGLLTGRGLLVQLGKGPSTRYELLP